jgi:hypothetical protein
MLSPDLEHLRNLSGPYVLGVMAVPGSAYRNDDAEGKAAAHRASPQCTRRLRHQASPTGHCCSTGRAALLELRGNRVRFELCKYSEQVEEAFAATVLPHDV